MTRTPFWKIAAKSHGHPDVRKSDTCARCARVDRLKAQMDKELARSVQ